MGNQMGCMGTKKKKKSAKINLTGMRKRSALEDELIEQQAMAIALHQQHKAQLRFERSLSHRDPSIAPPRKSYSGKPSSGRLDQFSRSSSTRARHIDDLLLDPRQLFNGSKEGLVSAALETKHFVLVHGGGLGAWCWYKTMALLEESGLVASAIDLSGSGIDSTDPNEIKSLQQYVKPLLKLLEKLDASEKVILVGHNIGGACISYAMECFPKKVSKAIFVAAAMVTNGQRAFEVFAQKEKKEEDLMPKAQKFLYGNGTSNPPTAVELDKALVRDLFFTLSPAKDVALATVSMRPIPFAPAMEKIVLTDENYGSVRRFYIETTEDQALSPEAQRSIVNQNPPELVFTLKGSDHSPFFSKPQSLQKIFIEIAMLDAKK